MSEPKNPSSIMHHQLPLSIQISDNATLDNFVMGTNESVIASLTSEDEQCCYLWGSEGLGKTHLLQALCQQMGVKQLPSIYLPLKQRDELAPEMLQGMECMGLVCIDDVDEIIADPEWEESLFHLFNACREANCKLVLSASVSPQKIAIKLPDLKSRLSWGLSLHLSELSDEEKRAALIMRAERRGLILPEEVATYLLRYGSRSMSDLYELLQKLDYESLAQQRKLTIPFVKSFL